MPAQAFPTMTVHQSHHRPGLGQDQDSNIIIPLNKEDTAKFQYEALDPSVDCTRLLEFVPSEDANDTLRCALIHVTFREKPKYEALSYMWGDETLKRKIIVNGKVFLVGQNLWDALHFLRKRGEGVRYWIDAICINQTNIPERNRQLRIIPHIYMRAHSVRVWLGGKYASCSGGVEKDLWIWKGFADARQNSPASQTSTRAARGLLDAEILKKLCSDNYWDRVWIVQEIGQARRINVCFGEVEVDWDTFIRKIDSYPHDTSQKSPMKLQQLRQEKYHDGHTLRKLLDTYQRAICKDPRDKIYGFVGLALDAREFPMDYQKSLWDVWKDTILFANSSGKLSVSEVIPFAKLVKGLLGDSSVARVDQVAQEYTSWTGSPLMVNEASENLTIFRLTAYVTGVITYVGPSPRQIISDLDTFDEWRARVLQTFPADLGKASLENDHLIQGLLDSEITETDVLSFLRPHILWKPLPTGSIFHEPRHEINKLEKEGTTTACVVQHTEAHISEETEQSVQSSEACLYLMKGIGDQIPPWRVGIAAGSVQAGDLICWIPEVDKAVAVRRDDNDWLRIVGMALVMKDPHQQASSWGCSSTDQKLVIHVDVETIYILLS